MKLTKSKLKQIIREELAVLQKAKRQFPNLVEASEASPAMIRDPASDPGSPTSGYENPSEGWHRLSKTEWNWLVKAVGTLQQRVNDLESMQGRASDPENV